MLELRPNCECCDKDLPVDSTNAFICSYECTFCKDCVDDILENVCPNCSGGFMPRPIRPKTSRRSGIGLAHQVASTKRVNTRYNVDEIRAFSQQFKHINPYNR